MRPLLMGVVAAVLAMGMAGPAAADDGSVLFAWGSNDFKQLGATSAGGSTAVAVTASGQLAGKRVTAVSAGFINSCAIADGQLFCWGSNVYGQLGTGASGSPVADPTAVTGLNGKTVTTVSVGSYHVCAVADGAAFCWGRNETGELGNGAAGPGASSKQPVAVTGLPAGAVTGITAGATHSCAVVGGEAYCWGDGTNGRLGNGSTNASSLPVKVSGLDGKAVRSLRAGATHTCAVADGAAYCWGAGGLGQLGTGSASPSSTPVAVTGLPAGKTVTSIRAGDSFSCALVEGVVHCWGANNAGQLGDGSQALRYSPAAVKGQLVGKVVTALAVGGAHSCAEVAGDMYCWGDNTRGQLGRSTSPSSLATSPGLVDTSGELSASTVRTFSAGANHSLFLAAQVPTVPRAVTAQAGPGTVTVSWQGPKDDGGRAISGYRVSTAGGSCETSELSCTVSALTPGQEYSFQVIARNAIGDSAVSTVSATPDALPVVVSPVDDPPVETSPAVVKGKQSFSVPKKLKKRGVTVVAVKGAKTSAGQPVTTTVKTKGKVKVIRKGGAVKIRGLGAKKWRVTVTQTAPGTETAEAFSQRVVYVNGKRR